MKTLRQREEEEEEQKVKDKMNGGKRPDVSVSMCASQYIYLTSILDELISRCKWVGISLETEFKLVRNFAEDWILEANESIHKHAHTYRE